MTKVMVYGTLMRKQSNHRYLRDSKFLGEATTKGKMFTLGYFPAIQLGEEGTIHGEVFEIDEPTLVELDHLEGHPRFYERVPIDTEYGECWIYTMKDVRGASEIPDGKWARVA